MKTAFELIAEERARQISVEGWTPEHDDKHGNGQLARAAACYVVGRPLLEFCGMIPAEGSDPYGDRPRVFHLWPWAREWWKPSPANRVRELAKAGALIAAEIDRLQRVANKVI